MSVCASFIPPSHPNNFTNPKKAYKRSTVITCRFSSSLSVAQRIWFCFFAGCQRFPNSCGCLTAGKQYLGSILQLKGAIVFWPERCWSSKWRVKGLQGEHIFNYSVDNNNKLITRINTSVVILMGSDSIMSVRVIGLRCIHLSSR